MLRLAAHILILATASQCFVLRTTPAMVWHAGSTQRRPIVAGNWKQNPPTLAAAKDLLNLVAANQRALESSGRKDAPDVCVFTPFPYLSTAIELLRGTSIKVGAQDVSTRAGGAFTGEVAAGMLQSMGCEFVLVGHSERRSLFEEDDAVVNEKLRASLDAGLQVILCVGETEQEYEMDLLASVVSMQVKKGLLGVAAEDLERVVIAYEPIWAIGTGKVATPEQAQAAHVAIREALAEQYDVQESRAMRIQYGGSVSPESVDDLMKQPDVDGALVGGASLKADAFARIVDFTDPFKPAENPRTVAAKEVVACRNVLGESPVWSERDGCLYWISAPEGELWCWNTRDAPFKRDFRQTIGCCALRAGEAGSLVLAMENGIYAYSVAAGKGSLVADAPEPCSTTRPNDGRVDRSGRLVFGGYNSYHSGGGPSTGLENTGLYRINAGGDVEELLDYKFRVSNAISFSPDGRTMYFCDSPTRKIYAFDYSDAGVANRRLVYTQPSALAGSPDGANVDSEGFLWVALSGASRVVRINPQTGETDLVVMLPVSSPTSLTFGGDDLGTLFITTRTRDGDGGQLFSVELPFGIRGVPEPEAVC